MFPEILWVHSSLWKARWINTSMHLSMRIMSRPYMRIVFSQVVGIYKQDNAKCQTAGSIRTSFEEHHDEFTVLSWPDLNPIKNLWDNLDRVVHAITADYGTAVGMAQHSREHLHDHNCFSSCSSRNIPLSERWLF
ncbi:DDE_3 domain-containing protein [Trichonephila clavipes]|nr:DDE_3 domain-containing protein [Trichonephila clavipes]